METLRRYFWRKPSDVPDRLELCDTITAKPAAVILNVSRKWHWKRSTSVMLHGAPPAEGVQSQLEEAKEAVVAELPDAEQLRRKKPR